jgi:hypothetical protein
VLVHVSEPGILGDCVKAPFFTSISTVAIGTP